MSNHWQNRFQAIEEMNNILAKETVQTITPGTSNKIIVSGIAYNQLIQIGVAKIICIRR